MVTEIIFCIACKVRCSLLIIFLVLTYFSLFNCKYLSEYQLAKERPMLGRGEFFIFIVSLPASPGKFTLHTVLSGPSEFFTQPNLLSLKKVAKILSLGFIQCKLLNFPKLSAVVHVIRSCAHAIFYFISLKTQVQAYRESKIFSVLLGSCKFQR